MSQKVKYRTEEKLEIVRRYLQGEKMNARKPKKTTKS